jgi:protein disulfide-isomerase
MMKTVILALSLASSSVASAATDVVLTDPWRQGDMDKAFADAKRDNKPMLLYWGAVWCPPCNELKNQVFAEPRFKDLVKPLIAVYLDGDQPNAQTWGEKLKVTGYPTVLLLGPKGDEWMRLTTGANIDEFETALTSALAAGGPATEALARAKAGKATTDDWRLLAYYSWYESDQLSLTQAETLQTYVELLKNVPKSMATESALLGSAALSALTGAGKESTPDAALKQAIDTARPHAKTWFATATKDDAATRRASRGFLLYESAEYVAAFVPKEDQMQAQTLVVAALDKLAVDETLSVDARLWTVGPKIAFAKQKQPEDTKPELLPVPLRKEVQAAVAKADKDAKSAYDRHAAISGAAYLLRQIGDYSGARELLMRELKQTDTPWYYESSLASVERAAGDDKAALKWSAAARASVKGRASRVQWIVEDLALTSKVLAPLDDGADARMAVIVKDYYDAALAEPDGFAGRNGARAKRVAESLKAWMSVAKVKAEVAAAAKRCNQATKEDGACRKHFTGLLTGA